MPRRNKAIAIKTNVVNVATKRPKQARKRAPRGVRPLPGIETGLSGLSITSPKGMGSLISRLSKEGHSLTEHGQAWALRYLDPCGEHKFMLDYGKIPDGALQTSAVPQYRFLETIELPFQTTGNVLLDGETYSALFLNAPLIRQLGILIVNADDREFDSILMTSFAKQYAQSSIVDARYPSFIPITLDSDTDAPRTWYTVFDTQALRAIDPPTELGVSTTVESLRVSSYGMRVVFNTPDLINQGTFAASRYPLNTSLKDINHDSIAGFEPFYLNVLIAPTGFTVSAIDNVPALLTGFFTASSPTFNPEHPIRNTSGSFIASIADDLQYVFTGGVVQLINNTTTEFMIISSTNNMQSMLTRLYYRLADFDESVIGLRDEVATVSLITIPPVTQSDILQANPRSVSGLLKEWGGLYLPNVIFEPVFRVQSSLAYAKVAFVTDSMTVDDVFNHIAGTYDTVDLNFGSTVVNMKSVPYAAKMQVKIERTDEIVPAKDSLIAAFSTGCPVKEELATAVAVGLADNEPHGYPSSYNGFGVLFAKMSAALRLLPRIIGTAQNIGACISEVSQEMSQASVSPKLMRLQRL